MADGLTRTLLFFGRYLTTEVLLAIAVGCTVGPEYHARPVAVPASYQPAAVA